MTSRIKLDLPDKFPRWATDSGRTLEPDESGAVQSNKDKGWLQDDRPPAREMNWLQNRAYDWIRQSAAMMVSNYYAGTNIYSGPGVVLWDEVRKFFIAAGPQYTELSERGDEWTTHAAITPAYTPEPSGRPGFNYTHSLIPANSGRLLYATDGTTWSAEDTGTGNTMKCVETKYQIGGGGSDYTIAGSDSGDIVFSTTGVGGVWTVPTTMPTFAGTPDIRDIVHIDDTSTWYGATDEQEVFKTVNDGVDWANLTNEPTGFFTAAAYGMDVNPTTGTIVYGGVNAAGTAGLIQYTTDEGATAWNTATVELSGLSSVLSGVQVVRYIGGNMWVIGTASVASSGYYPITIYISIDDGQTWKPASRYPVWTSFAVKSIAISTQQIMIHDGTEIAYSNAIIGT